MAIKFDLGDMQAFAAVADLGSFGKAAEALHISQPAFSRRINKLESALGVLLLDRTTRRVHLTAVGRDFAHKVRQMLDELDTTLLGMQDVAATRMGVVTIACIASAMNNFLTRVISRYHATYPKIRINIIDSIANDVLAAVASGEADFGLTFLGTHEPDIDFHMILEDNFVVACRRDHRLAGKQQVSWSELGQYDFMTVSKRSGNRLIMDMALANIPQRPRSIYEAQHLTTLLGLVEAGIGVAAVPALSISDAHHPSLVSVPLVDPVITRKLGLIRRNGRSLSPAAQPLYTLIYDLSMPDRTGASSMPGVTTP